MYSDLGSPRSPTFRKHEFTVDIDEIDFRLRWMHPELDCSYFYKYWPTNQSLIDIFCYLWMKVEESCPSFSVRNISDIVLSKTGTSLNHPAYLSFRRFIFSNSRISTVKDKALKGKDIDADSAYRLFEILREILIHSTGNVFQQSSLIGPLNGKKSPSIHKKSKQIIKSGNMLHFEGLKETSRSTRNTVEMLQDQFSPEIAGLLKKLDFGYFQDLSVLLLEIGKEINMAIMEKTIASGDMQNFRIEKNALFSKALEKIKMIKLS